MADLEATEADRDTFRDRLKEAIADAGTTAKAIEEQLGLSRGTLTRVYGGRRNLDAELLAALSEAVGMPAEHLVEGTAFQALIEPVVVEEPVVEEPVVEEPVVEEPVVEEEPVEEEPVVDEAPVSEGEASSEEPAGDEPVADVGSDEPVAAPSESVPPPADDDRSEAGGRSEESRRRKVLQVPIKAAVAIAGGLAVVGGALAALIRRR